MWHISMSLDTEVVIHITVRVFKAGRISAYTGHDGAVVMSSANGLVGTGIASQYRLQPRAGFKGTMGRGMATAPSSLSLTSNRVTTNY